MLIVDIKSILNNTSLYNNRFDSLKSDKNLAFVVSMSPLLEYSLKEINNCIKRCNLLNIVESKCIESLIKKDFAKRINQLIIQIYIFELTQASSMKLLMGDTPNARYKFYIEQLLYKDNKIALLNKYPVLEQLLQNITQDFINATFLFLEHLAKDIKDINNKFFKCDQIKLYKIITKGDLHRNGKAVLLLYFKIFHKNNTNYKNMRILYKPRSLDIDLVFADIALWIRNHSVEVTFLSYGLLSYKDHGYCEFLEASPCKNSKELRNYYINMGGYLALVKLLRGYDFHYENIIPCGQHPMLIDLECLCTPQIKLDNGNNSIGYCSVLDTAMIPSKDSVVYNENGLDIDISALAYNINNQAGLPKSLFKLENLETDQIKITRTKASINLNKKQRIPFLEYKDAFIKGFEDIYNIIIENKQKLLAKTSPLYKIQSLETRIVLRNTFDYAKLLNESFHPKYIYDKAERDKHFSWLDKKAETHIEFANILYSEKQDLNRLNIPIFTNICNDSTVYNGNKEAVNLKIVKTGFDSVIDNLKYSFHKQDLFIQKTIINNSFVAHEVNNKANIDNTIKLSNAVSCQTIILDTKIYRKQANIFSKGILNFLVKSNIVDSNSNYFGWPSNNLIDTSSGSKAFSSNISGWDFYDDNLGAILLLNAGYLEFKDTTYLNILNIALSSLYTYCEKVVTDQRYLEFNLLKHELKVLDIFGNIGVFTGIGGLIYGLTAIYQSHQNPFIVKTISTLLSIIRKLQLIKHDKKLDFLSGAAGALLVLQKVTNTFPQFNTDDLQAQCIQQIIDHYPALDIQLESMSLNKNLPSVGFAHGVSGIIYAFSKYQETCTNKHLCEIIENWLIKAIQYESNIFTLYNGWIDLRKVDDNKNLKPTSWCSGSVGIGISKIMLNNLAKYTTNDKYKKYTDNNYNIIKQVYQSILNQYDENISYSLCHGVMGNLEFLYLANKYYPRIVPNYEYTKYLCDILKKLELHGVNQLINIENNIGLMTGMSGVAYTLLRVLNKGHNIKSILLLE